MKLFRRFFLLSMMLSSTFFFLQCSTCSKKTDPVVTPPAAYTAVEQVVGDKAWSITEALEDDKLIVLVTAGSMKLSFTKEGEGDKATAKTFSAVVVPGVTSPTGTATSGAYSIDGSTITFNPGGVSQFQVNYVMTPTGGREFATTLVLTFEYTTDPAKPKKKYKFTYKR